MRILTYGLVGTNRGGIETFLLNMNESMSGNCVFDYVVEEDECIHGSRIADNGGRVYYIAGRRHNPLANLADNWNLLRKARKNHWKAYFNVSSLSWVFPIVEARLLGVDTFVHAHNAAFVDCNNTFIHRIANRIGRGVLRRLKIKRLSCSRPCTEFIFGSNSDVELVRNAVSVERFRFSESTREWMRSRLGVSNRLVIGFMGRFAYQKHPDYLVDIACLMEGASFPWSIVMVGDGPMRKEVEQEVSDKGLRDCFIFAGNVDNPSDYLQAFDLLLLPSRHEGLPYVAIEAQASGLPCFLSDAITREVSVTDLVSFLPVDGFSPDRWVKAIETAYDSGDRVLAKRAEYAEIVENSGYGIRSEAARLEDALCNG